MILYKSSLNGFAKLEFFIPTGFNLKFIKNYNATIICKNQIIKLIWIDLPQISTLNIKAKMKIDYRLNGYKEIFATFFYVENKEIKYQSFVFPIKILNDTDYTYRPAFDKEEFKNIEIETYNLPTKPKSSTFYRVQIGAFNKRLDKKTLKEFFYHTEFIYEEYIDNFYKYTIGNFNSFDEALNFAKKCGINGAFVVKYVDGKRTK